MRAYCLCVHLLQGGGLAAVADLGGSILTGIDGNPLAVLARPLRIPLHHINSEGVPLYCADGREANRRLDQQARTPRQRTQCAQLLRIWIGLCRTHPMVCSCPEG